MFFHVARRRSRSPLFRYTTLFRSYGEIVAVVLDPSVRSTQQPLLASMGLTLLERAEGSRDRKSTRLNSSHRCRSYAVFSLKKTRSGTATLSSPCSASCSRLRRAEG